MAAFNDNEIDACVPIWNLFQNGAVTLFRRRELWRETLALLEAHSYRIVLVDCSECADESDLLFSVVDTLKIERYSTINLDGFNDFMSQIEFHDSTGVIICLDAFDSFCSQYATTSKTILDILADTHRHAILVGDRLATIVQSDDPRLDQSIGKIGGFIPQWNTAEWMNRDRGL